MLSQRVALPAGAALAIALVAISAPRHPRVLSPPAPPAVQEVSVSNSETDPAPALAHYQMIASQSLDKHPAAPRHLFRAVFVLPGITLWNS